METPPRSLMASYLERWEEQKAQSRRERERQARRRSSDVGDELSFISAIEREAAQQEQRSANVDAPERKWEEREVDSFDLPAMDAFPPSSFAQEGQEVLQPTALPAEEEFVDAATFLKQNELGEEDSFSQDVGEFLNGNWEQNTSGRPSDFFEKKSRNMEHVELSSPRQVDDFFGDVDAEKTEGEKLESLIPQEEGSPVDPQQGAALHDRLDRSSGLSGSGTALSSGYDVHFDNARLVYTPNTLKHLQEKSRARNTSETWRNDKSIDKAVNYTSDAKDATQYPPFPVEQNIPEDISPKYVVALQRGPGVIKEALNEIDALIDASSRSAEEPSLGVDLSEDMREFVRAYELPLESMLPLSRTTDSWGEDVSVSQVEDDMNRRSRELGRLSSGTDSRRPTLNGVSRSRSQETPELDTIREVGDSVPQSQQSDSCHQLLRASLSETPGDFDADVDSARARPPDHLMGASNASSDCVSDVEDKHSSILKTRRAKQPDTLDQSLAEVAATQNPFHDEFYRSQCNEFGPGNDEQPGSDDQDSDVIGAQSQGMNRGKIQQGRDKHHNAVRASLGDEREQDKLSTSDSDDTNLTGLRFRYKANSQTTQRIPRKKRIDDQLSVRDGLKSKTKAVQKHLSTPDRLLEVLDNNRPQVAIESAQMPRRCRRFLCSVGDIMTEQVVFTNGTNSVGRICVSLLPLSTGCQQFSVSPAVLELGPKASNSFHVTFNARHAGAVSGIFQFRGVGVESLFRPYEVVIEASVKMRRELEGPNKSTPNERRELTAERVRELHASTSVDQVQISPTFIRFDRVRNKGGDKTVRQAKLRLSNNTAQTLPFKVRSLESLKIRPATGMIQPASEVIISVLPISQPVAQHRVEGDEISTHSSLRGEDWYGSLTVQVGTTFLREVSVVVDRRVIKMLPQFDEIARSRHQISSQTDSFYYTKRGKRRGLYFHARAVEFGCCNVGESHEVPVYVCNGSKVPMTVFLQDLQEPFSCNYSTTTIEPRKFIEVMVTFTPKVVGKVATSLFAYSVSDKAVVTLVARGI